MICKPCRMAGHWNAQWSQVLPERRGEFGSLRSLAQKGHDECKGGTQCDCQHVVGRTARAGREPK